MESMSMETSIQTWRKIKHFCYNITSSYFLQSKPPLPENRRKAVSRDQNSFKSEQEKSNRGSINQSCLDEQSTIEDEQFFSACESLDMPEGKYLHRLLNWSPMYIKNVTF